jgi:putative ABC transport system permease protein
VDVGYFETTGIAIQQGRGFTEADRVGSVPVAVINDTMARRFWPNENPIGRRFRFYTERDYREVVGVARTAKYVTLGEAPQAAAYFPLRQSTNDAMVLYVRAAGDPAPLLGPVQGEIRQIDPNVPIQSPQRVRDVIDQSLWAVNLGAGLLAVFGILALALACVGLYGVMAYSVGQRTQEIGLRMALGAGPGQVLRLVLQQGLTLVAIGTALGVAGALGLSRLLQSLLFGSAYDPLSFIAASAALIAVAAVASFLPALRASRVDPLVALREG